MIKISGLVSNGDGVAAVLKHDCVPDPGVRVVRVGEDTERDEVVVEGGAVEDVCAAGASSSMLFA